MINCVTLRFDDPEIQKKYDDYQAQVFRQRYITISIITQISMILQVVQTIYDEDFLTLTFTVSFFPINVISLLATRRRGKHIYIIQLLTSFIILAALFRARTWILSFNCAAFQIAILSLGTNIYVGIIQWVTIMVLPMIYLDMNTLQKLQAILMIVIGIVLWYQLEKNRRQNFLTILQNDKWGNLIEKTLPSWVVILKYDHIQTQITIDKINKNLQHELDIENERKLRSIIRRMFVFPTESVTQNFRPISTADKVDFEQELTKLLKQPQVDKNKEVFIWNNCYQAFPNRTRIYKITVTHFFQLQPLVLLLFEEITENKFEELSNSITWRDIFVESLAEKTLSQTGQCIAFLKTLLNGINMNNKLLPTSAAAKLTSEMRSQIQKQFMTFNTNLNSLTLSLIEERKLKFKIDTIDLTNLQESLSQDIQMNIQTKVPKTRVTKSFLKRSGSRQVNVPANQIINDRQKLIQVILSFVEFIHFLNFNNNTHPLKVPVQLSISTVKKSTATYAVRIFHPFLIIPNAVQKIINNNWAGSAHNHERWGQVQNFKIIQQLTDALHDYVQKQMEQSPRLMYLNKEQMFNRLTLSGVPLAIYLISQMGPFNLLFFKRKEMKKEQFQSVLQVPALSAKRSQTIEVEEKRDHFMESSQPHHPTFQAEPSQPSQFRRNLKQHLTQTFARSPDFRQRQKHQNRQKSISDHEPGANQIKFFVYKDLREVIEEINKMEISMPFENDLKVKIDSRDQLHCSQKTQTMRRQASRVIDDFMQIERRETIVRSKKQL